MCKIKRIAIWIMILCAMQSFETLVLAKNHTARMTGAERFEMMRKEAESGMLNIEFYGKVVDQFDEPVVDAEITVGVTTIYAPKGTKAVMLKTNEQGLFTLQDVGTLVYIRKIEKHRYEFTYEKNPKRGYRYSTPSGPYHSPDPNSPVVFYMRKKGEIAWLLADGYSGNLWFDANEVESISFYLFKTGWINENLESGRIPGEKFKRKSVPSYRKGPKDVRADGRPTEDGLYEVCFTPLHEDSGIIISDKLLYEAPAEGYEPNAIILVDPDLPESKTKKQYLYIKTEGGKFYSRINLQPSGRTDKVLVEIQRFTNPTGSRNLEHDEKFNFKEKRRRSDERKKRYQERVRKAKEKKRLEDEKRAKRQAAEKKAKE